MVGKLLLKGMLAGLIAGVVTFFFFKVFGEPWVEHAIALEEQAATASGATNMEPEIVSRATQAGMGLLSGVLVYGAAIGGLFAISFAFANGRLGRLNSRETAMLLAGLCFIAVILVPALKYPANPPAVGSGETIDARTQLYFGMMAISVLAAIAAIALAGRLRSTVGGWNASLVAGAGYVIIVGLASVALPSINEVPESFPANTLWNFRFASLSGHAIFWIGLAIAFDTLRKWKDNSAT